MREDMIEKMNAFKPQGNIEQITISHMLQSQEARLKAKQKKAMLRKKYYYEAGGIQPQENEDDEQMKREDDDNEG